IDNVSYADILEILKIKKAFNVKQCGNVLEFKPTDEGYLKLHKTWFCKSKLCPVCNWRRAMKNSYQAQRVIEEVVRSEEHTSELQSRFDLVCRLLLEKKKK